MLLSTWFYQRSFRKPFHRKELSQKHDDRMCHMKFINHYYITNSVCL
jgi:hypothetical protein